MSPLELFEYLAYHPYYNQTDLNLLLFNQEKSLKEALINKNGEAIKEYFSNGDMLADKTTIFNINL